MEQNSKGHPRVAAPRFFSHLANELSRIPADCPRSKLPRVISRRLGGLSVHEPLPSCELTGSGTDRAFAAFQRPRASFNIHKILATIMHYKQAFYNPRYLIIYRLHSLLASHVFATQCTEEQQKTKAHILPGKQQGFPRFPPRRGSYLRHFHGSSWRLPHACS